jgi:UDP:flavonoid glycosyltransferase YjiC (YdhE family)
MNKKKTKKATKRFKITENIILTAGGTGGHIVPAMKIASDLIAQGKTVFFITDKRFTNYEKLFKNYSFFSSKKLKIVTIPVTSFNASKTSLHFLKDCLFSLIITLVTFLSDAIELVIRKYFLYIYYHKNHKKS